MGTTAIEKMSAARTALLMDRPFFGALVMRLKLVEAHNTRYGTMDTDGRAIYYDPRFVLRLEPREVAFVQAHEAVHCAMQHIGRRGDRDQEKWQHAIDYATNAILVEAGMKMPEGGLYDSAYIGMSAEAIYDALPDDFAGAGQGWQWGIALDGDASEELAQEWKQAVAEAIAAARLAGDKASERARALLGEMLAPRVDWRAQLREFMERSVCGATDYSWCRPARGWIAQDIYLPGVVGERGAPIVVVVDTSGSIDDDVLRAFTVELRGIHLDFAPAALHVLYADAAVHVHNTFLPGDELELDSTVGGGGTDFRPAFDWVAEHAPDVAAVVYLTDGEGRYPREAPPWPVLWAMTADVAPPWGRVIRLEI